MLEVTKYIPLGLFTLFASKLLILGNISLESCLILLILGSMHAVYHLKLKLDSNKELQKRMEAIEASRATEKEELERIKAVINTVKAAQGLRSANVR